VKLVITGATGFIGSHMVPALARRHDVVCLVRNPSLFNVPGVEVVRGDLGQLDGLSALPGAADAVLHFAQANVPVPDESNVMFEVNAGSTQRLADYARRSGVEHFVYASSGSVYAPSADALSEDSALAPNGMYPTTKQVSELVLASYAAEFNVCALRLFTPYGPGQTGRMIPGIMGRVRDGRPVTLTNGGQPQINPVYVDDVTVVVESALQLAGHEVFNVAGPQVVSVGDIAQIAADLYGRNAQIEHQEADTAWNIIAETTKMHSLFDLPDLVEPREGIRRMIEAERAN